MVEGNIFSEDHGPGALLALPWGPRRHHPRQRCLLADLRHGEGKKYGRCYGPNNQTPDFGAHGLPIVAERNEQARGVCASRITADLSARSASVKYLKSCYVALS
jgi:hypothetical protein